MTEAERQPLIEKIKAGDSKTLALFWEEHEKLIYKMLGSIWADKNNTEDLRQECFLALWETCLVYNPEYPYFIKLWKWKIYRHLYDFFSDVSGVRLPAYMRSIVNRMKVAKEENPNITETELAEQIETSLENIRLALVFSGELYSLDAPFSSFTEEFSLLDTLADSSVDIEAEALKEVEKSETWEMVKKTLKGAEFEAIKKKYLEEKTVEQVAEEMQLSKGAVAGLLKKALKNLKIANGVEKLAQRKTKNYGRILRGAGIKSFNRTFNSSVERTVMINDEITRELLRKINRERERQEREYQKRIKQG